MSIMIGQISYLPDNELRTKRLTSARTQLEWFNKVLPNAKIISVCQAYTELECDVEGVEYMRFSKGIGAGNARNVLLNIFYNSDYDWLFLCDDDTIAYPYYNYENFFEEMSNNIDKFSKLDAISAIEPEYHPYKKLNFEDKGNLTHYKFEPRELNSGSATSFIRNIKKYYHLELYYPETDANKGEGREDIEFLLQWLLLGLNWYNMDTWIRKSLCFDQSSIFGGDTKARDKLLMHDLDVVCEKYKNYGLYRNEKGRITWKNFNDLYNKTEKVLYIPRKVPIVFDEKTTPKTPKTSSKNLF